MSTNERRTDPAPMNVSKRGPKASLSNCHLQVLGTGGGELKPCVFLFTDSKRYMFNCVENGQRFSNEYKVRQSKLRDFFITRMTWDNVGGLPGQSLHFANFFDAPAMNPVQLHGPDSIADFIHSSRFHVNPAKIKLMTNGTLEALGGYHLPVHHDENLTVYTLNLHDPTRPASPISPPSSESETEEDPALQRPSQKRPRISRNSNSISVFLCKLADVPGKFDPQKALDLGLPKGPQYRALVNGESVTAPNGTVVHPSDVVGPIRAGPNFIVLECPDQGYVPSIASHPLLQKKSFDDSYQRIALIVHMTPRAVVDSDAYCQWMASFGPRTKHLLLHETLCPHNWTLRGFLKTQGPLNLMEPTIFRRFSESLEEVEPAESLKVLRLLPRECVIIGKTLMQYHLKPSQKEGVDESQVLESFASHWQKVMDRVKTSPEVSRAMKKIPAVTESEKSITNVQCATLEKSTSTDNDSVTFLGTGASCPSKYRNVSSILLQTASSGNVLLDCGEGTLAQLYRHFGAAEGDRVLARLGVIFISHIHGDHNLGVISLLNKRAHLLRSSSPSSELMAPTWVVGPKKVLWWLRDYSHYCEKLLYRFIDCSKLTEDESAIGNTRLGFQTVPVIHCKESYGVVISHRKDWRIVYSGDTRPCPALAKVGRNATLLLHEATLEDGMLADAKEKKHCTITEALQMAELMNPDFTILTHFSQRYSKILPLILSKRTDLKSKVFAAFDHMTVPLASVHRLPALLPSIQEILMCTKDDDDTPVTWGW